MKKLLLFSMCFTLSIFTVFAQVNPAISVHNPKAEITQQTQDLSLQKEMDLKALHPGKNIINPPPKERYPHAVGDNCADPIIATFPAALPYSDTRSTQFAVDDYNLTDLGIYDSGPDVIYQIVVTATTEMQFTVTPVGSYQYAGMGLFSSCPPDFNNEIVLAHSNNGAISFTQILMPGTYILMVDNWAPGPDYINYTLTIVIPPPPAPGATCSTALNYGNVNDPAVNGTLAAGASVWYSFTSPVNMMTTVSLCGTTIDTKLEIYTACDAAYSFYNDDFACGIYSYASQISDIEVLAGQTYYARVYGYGSTEAGPFTITITSITRPANDECTNAQFISGPYPQVVNGTTINAAIDCPSDLSWNAVWYEIDLPYAVNNLSIDFCGNSPDLAGLGIIYYNDCSNCTAYSLFTYTSCTGGWELTAPGIPGPATIFFPAYVGYTGRDFQFAVDVSSPGPPELPLSNWALILGGLLIGAYAFYMIRRRS